MEIHGNSRTAFLSQQAAGRPESQVTAVGEFDDPHVVLPQPAR
ncbi:hypothetical protein amrb99_03830 [Actinomadura sp. RB99]|nr:hypothetical protein [Actinomadura sp. RB99]